MAFDRFNDKPERRERRNFDRPQRGEGFGERRRFEDRRNGFGNQRSRFDGDRPQKGDKFGARRDAGRFDGVKRSGPRAKAVQVRRHSDRNAFVQTATVRLDADVFAYFKTAEDVNAALREVIALAGLVKRPQSEAACQESPVAAPEPISGASDEDDL